MSDLPSDWELVELGDIVDLLDSKRVPVNAEERANRPGDVPYYGATGQVGWIDEALFDEELVLLGEDGAPFLDPSKPKAYLIDGPSWVNNHAHVLRAISEATTNRFLKYVLDAVDYRQHVNGTTRLKLTQKAMRAISIPLPPRAEQERIVVAIEEHLSRLDAAEGAVQPTGAKLGILRMTTVWEVLTRRAWPSATWGDVGQTLSGRAFPSASYTDNGVPLLRPGNLSKSGAVTWAPRATTHLPDSYAEQFPKYVLRGRNLLMNLTAQSLADDFLGRVCLSDDDDRFLLNQRIAKLSSPLAQDNYLYWVFRSASFRRFVAGLNTGSLIQHISTRQLASFEFPLPPLKDQRELVNEIETAVETVDRLESGLAGVPQRSCQLRRSILGAAFNGKLVSQDPAAEPASVLLDRIKAERAAAAPTKGTRRAKT